MPDCKPVSNGCKVLLQGPHRLRISGINPQLSIVSKLKHLGGEAQVIDVDDEKEGPQSSPLGNTTVKSGPVRWHTIDDDPLPPSCQPVPYSGTNIALDAQIANFLHEPFIRDFGRGLEEVSKDFIHGFRTVTLTEYVIVKVEEVSDTRPSSTKTVLMRL